MAELSDLERQVLTFETGRWNHQGAKDEAVLRQFGLTPVRYQQWVLALIDRPEALQAEPQLVHRLRRLRAERRRVRSSTT